MQGRNGLTPVKLEMLPALKGSCDAVCSYVQDFIVEHPKCHTAAPPPAAAHSAAGYPQKAASPYVTPDAEKSPSGAHLQYTGTHCEATTTQLGAARPRAQAAKRANPPARSIGTREATGLPSSETNSRAGTLSLGENSRTSPGVVLVTKPTWLYVPRDKLNLAISDYLQWHAVHRGARYCSANIREIVRYVVQKHISNLSFAYLAHVRESARSLMHCLNLIAPNQTQTDS
jgi:hypothetical protein